MTAPRSVGDLVVELHGLRVAGSDVKVFTWNTDVVLKQVVQGSSHSRRLSSAYVVVLLVLLLKGVHQVDLVKIWCQKWCVISKHDHDQNRSDGFGENVCGISS